MDMKRFDQIVEKYEDVDFSTKRVSDSELETILKQYDLKMGPQLRTYVLNYGYLGCRNVEFYGVNAIQKEKSDMFVQTEYLHKYFDLTKNFIAFESKGEGDYVLIDEKDEMWLFDSEEKKLTKLNKILYEYIEETFDTL